MPSLGTKWRGNLDCVLKSKGEPLEKSKKKKRCGSCFPGKCKRNSRERRPLRRTMMNRQFCGREISRTMKLRIRDYNRKSRQSTKKTLNFCSNTCTRRRVRLLKERWTGKSFNLTNLCSVKSKWSGKWVAKLMVCQELVNEYLSD